METTNSVVALFDEHVTAEAAVKKLIAAGFEMKKLSVVGKGCHSEEKVVGFYNAGDRIKFWECEVRSGAAFGACSSAGCS